MCLSCCITLCTVGGLLDTGLTERALASKSISHLWSLGFGTVTSEQLVRIKLSGTSGLIGGILIANFPQLLLSFLYLMYNSLFTCMLLAQEWNKYAHHRKALRVTSPRGKQRSTYWLQLPYQYAIPLLVASGLLHWLVSQSIFLANVKVYDSNDKFLEDESASTLGYSSIATIFVLVLGAFLIIIGIACGFRQYEPGMPLVRSSSAAISAACHPPKSDQGVSTKPVMWGVVGTLTFDDNGEPVGHCSFSSMDVEPPVVGRLYS